MVSKKEYDLRFKRGTCCHCGKQAIRVLVDGKIKLKTYCISCRKKKKVYDKKYSQKNHKKLMALQKAWRDANPDYMFRRKNNGFLRDESFIRPIHKAFGLVKKRQPFCSVEETDDVTRDWNKVTCDYCHLMRY